MQWCSDVFHRNNNDNDCESFKYGMGSDGKPKAWCTVCFSEFSETRIDLGGAADSDIQTVRRRLAKFC